MNAHFDPITAGPWDVLPWEDDARDWSQPPAFLRPPRVPELGRAEADQQARLHRALVYLESHLASRIEVAEVARVACYTARHFQRVFQDFIGESVSAYLRRLRLRRAAVLLTYWEWPVLEVAQSCGFDSASGFARAFAEHHGCSPSEYRERHAAAHRFTPGARPRPPGEAPIPIRFARFPTLRVAFMRHVGSPLDAARTWLRLLAWAWPRGLINGRTRPLGLHRDDESVPLAEQRYDAALVVGADFEPCEAVGVCKLPGGLVMLHDFRGTIEELHRRWQVFADEWLPQSGYELRGDAGIDLYAPHQLSLRRLTALLTKREPLVEATLCVPVR